MVSGVTARAVGLDYSDLLLDVNWNNIEQVGHQAVGNSISCACYSLAYCRTMLDDEVHRCSEYNLGASEWDAWTNWVVGDYEGHFPSGKDTAFRLTYDSLNEGKPVCVKVKGTRSSHHYVAVVGYENVTDISKLSAENFLIIDPCASEFKVENMADVGYDLKYEENNFQVETDTSSNTVNFDGILPGCTVLPTLADVQVTSASCYLKSLPYSVKTNEDSISLHNDEPMPVGTYFTIDAIVFNSVGNTWYRTNYEGERGYLYSGDVTVTEIKYDEKLSDASYPAGTLSQGSVYPVAGKITSSHPLEEIYVAVLRADGAAACEKSESIALKHRYSISQDIDYAMTFNELEPGDYTFVIRVTEQVNDPAINACRDITTEIVSQSFRVE